MSFRTAYQSLKSGGGSRKTPQGGFRDPTPEEWKRNLDQYYIQQTKKTGAK